MLKFFLYLFPLIFFLMHSVVGMRVAQDTGPPPTWTTIEKSHPKSAPVLSWEPLVSQSEIECMAKNIYFEAAVESTAGQLAVAQVTLNRVKSKHYPNSVCEVVYEGPKHANGIMKRDRCQFSWYCDGKDDEVRNKGKLWNTAQSLAKYVLSRQKDLIDITDGALFYHANYIDAPRWTQRKEVHASIDQHIFYGKNKRGI
jgi:spore germination cell wall hydrolase CwlJ-like protein